MGRQRRRGDSRKRKKRLYDDEFEGARDNRHGPELAKKKRPGKIKNEKILLDILAENPEAEEELATE